MTRTQFDEQLRELKTQRNNAVREIAARQAELKEEIASKNRYISEINKAKMMLKQTLQGYHLKRVALSSEWDKKINQFINDNEQSTTSNLAEASTLNIVYELRRRGFGGVISRDTDDGIESYDLQKTDWNNEASGHQ